MKKKWVRNYCTEMVEDFGRFIKKMSQKLLHWNGYRLIDYITIFPFSRCTDLSEPGQYLGFVVELFSLLEKNSHFDKKKTVYFVIKIMYLFLKKLLFMYFFPNAYFGLVVPCQDFWWWDVHVVKLCFPDDMSGNMWMWGVRESLNINFTKVSISWLLW